MRININVKEDNQLSFNTSEPITIDELISTVMTLSLAAMNQVVANAPEGRTEEARGSLYDFFNIAASKTLALFAPELELRPNLTTQAILEAENNIIREGRLGEVEVGS